jgi:hypothetical protein
MKTKEVKAALIVLKPRCKERWSTSHLSEPIPE